MAMLLTFSGIFRKIETMADRGLRVRIDTQELPAESARLLFECRDTFGTFAYRKDSGISDEEVLALPVSTPDFSRAKTPSQRLRAALFVLWKSAPDGDFESFYLDRMETIIDEVKAQI